MSTVDYSDRVVVGVDGSGQSAIATEWVPSAPLRL